MQVTSGCYQSPVSGFLVELPQKAGTGASPVFATRAGLPVDGPNSGRVRGQDLA